MKYELILWRRMLSSAAFWCCVSTIALLCFFSPLYHDYSLGQEYSIMDVMMHFSRDRLEQDVSFSAIYVVYHGFQSWICIFAPVLIALPVLTVKLSETESGLARFVSVRLNHKKKLAGVCNFYLLAGAAALVTGFLLFCLITFTFFPSMNRYSVDSVYQINSQLYPDGSLIGAAYHNGGSLLAFLLYLSGLFLYGVSCNTIVLFCSCLSDNMYVITCLPFFFHYSCERISTLLSVNLSGNTSSTIYRIVNAFNPNALLYSFLYPIDHIWVWSYHGIRTALCIIAYIAICKRRARYDFLI